MNLNDIFPLEPFPPIASFSGNVQRLGNNAHAANILFGAADRYFSQLVAEFVGRLLTVPVLSCEHRKPDASSQHGMLQLNA